MENYVCSECGAGAYYDGRCGDGPILMCRCSKRGKVYYDGRCGDGPVRINDARPVPADEFVADDYPNPWENDRR